MVKVSITLPNKAQITFESEEPEVIHEIVGMVLRDLPRELMLSVAAETANGNGTHPPPEEKGNGVPAVVRDTPAAPEAPEAPSDESGTASTGNGAGSARKGPVKAEEAPAPAPQAEGLDLSPSEQEFVAFCRTSNPLGDMRRVVVAAEGARRHLSRASVDADELGRLFDLAGWKRPHSFIQTLRNSARSKFRWLERVPGRAGHYSVTDLGRSVALGE